MAAFIADGLCWMDAGQNWRSLDSGGLSALFLRWVGGLWDADDQVGSRPLLLGDALAFLDLVLGASS